LANQLLVLDQLKVNNTYILKKPEFFRAFFVAK